MNKQHNNFRINGTSALKEETTAFDVYAKPSFTSGSDAASIIDFDDARAEHDLANGHEDVLVEVHKRSVKALLGAIARKIRNDRILSGLFESKKGNAYSKGDLGIFAKGFTLTGLAAFVMILFGV